MAQIIAGLYEIQNQIGAGGGGIVYLGRHIRLDKQVVLKADKRKLSADTETLRREVDMLKNLTHTYIPQVYDFVQEGDTVYTVMDYIEGESLDKFLGRGQKITQPQIIKWACQLLAALKYLHSRPPHGILHGDIKPANIMLRPTGDICLIDYNIALALGEDGAVKVGFSKGYASPEHYGADYIVCNKPASVSRRTLQLGDTTELIDTNGEQRYSKENGTTKSSKGILLDARSDIYSLGATLYHLISGTKPAQDAREVVPLGSDICSPGVSAILQKAMAPQPEKRYKSAEEMLTAFFRLYKTDKRTIRHKRRMVLTGILLGILFTTGGVSAFIGLNQLKQREKALVLAEYSSNALADGDVAGALKYALQAIPSGNSILDAPVTAQAQKALTDALGIYDMSEGLKPLDSVQLPSVPFTIAVSPKGTRFAAVYAYETAVYDADTRQMIVTLPVQKSALSDVIFINENRLIYAGSDGVAAYDIEQGKVLWSGETATILTASDDGTTLAALNENADGVTIYRIDDGTKIIERSFEGKQLAIPFNDIYADSDNSIFALNENGTRLAVSFSNGGFYILNLEDMEEDLIVYDESDYVRFDGAFQDRYFAYIANKSDKSVFGIIDTVDAVSFGEFESDDNFLFNDDNGEINIARGNLLVSYDPETLGEKELAYTDSNTITGISVKNDYTLVTTDNNSLFFYDKGAHRISETSSNAHYDFVSLTDDYALLARRDDPIIRMFEVVKHNEARVLSYDAGYGHDEARISHDGKTAMLFSYQGFRIYGLNGNVIAEGKFPDAEQIYDQQFRKDETNSYLEVIWYDGTVRCYDAADGKKISETMGEKPLKDLYEEFYTEKYRIESTLHEAPRVYDIQSGKLIAILEEDAGLTYITEAGEYVIAEYINTEGKRYGALLNENFETLAYFPDMCDYADGKVIFDTGSGNLVESPVYSLDELIEMAE